MGQYSTKFIPDEDGDWEFGLALAGLGNLFIDGRLAIDLSTNPTNGDLFFGLGTGEMRTIVKGLKAKQSYNMEIRTCNATIVAKESPFTFWGGIQLGGLRQVGQEDAIRNAVALAKESDGTKSRETHQLKSNVKRMYHSYHPCHRLESRVRGLLCLCSRLLTQRSFSWESEGFDRKDLELPGLTNRLVSEVLRADPNAIVINQSGT